MALNTDFLLDVLIKIVIVAGRALIVPRTLQYHRALLFRHVAGIAIKAGLLNMEIVQIKWGVSGLGGRLRGRRRLRW